MQVINTHLASPAVSVENKENFISLYHANYKMRKEQIKRIEQEVVENADNYNCQLLIGDLNTTEYEPVFKSLKMN